MPKRKKSKSDYDFLSKEIKKLKKKLKRARDLSESSSSSETNNSSSNSRNSAENILDELLADSQIPSGIMSDEDITPTSVENVDLPPTSENTKVPSNTEVPSNLNTTPSEKSREEDNLILPETVDCDKTSLDSDIMDILGEDPSISVQYGPEIHKELASRLQHITTAGLTKETRKELSQKYLLPSNGSLLGAPISNLEIKAALPDTLVNRDKAFETKQKLLGSAISCLASATTQLLNSTDKNNELLKKLMDTNRLLCDIQHSDSVTRRMFSMSVLKKDVKNQIQNTKIDKSLFGENLPDTLKTAKAVSKSSSEIKVSNNANITANKSKPSTSKSGHLNAKAPVAAARKPPTTTQKTRQPAYHQNQHYKSSKTSSHHPRSTQHRR